MRKTIAIALGLTYAAAFAFAVNAQQRAGDGPHQRREHARSAGGLPRVDVFQQRPRDDLRRGRRLGERAAAVRKRLRESSSHRRFMQTGTWPDRTIFVLEQRGSATERLNRQGWTISNRRWRGSKLK